jgi:serine/threonine-protein kinase
MSPEQVLGRPTDARSDIFSFGSVLYELLAGEAPFRAANEIATAHAIAYEEPAPLRRLRAEVPEGLELIVAKCMAKSRDERYATVEELAADLRRLRQDYRSGSHDARRLLAYRSSRSRHRVLLVAAAAIAIGVPLAAWLLRDARPEPEPALEPPAAAGVPWPGAPGSHVPRKAARSGRPRVIVGSFDNASGGAETEAVSRGLPEMLTTDLSRSPGLEVIATQRLWDLMAQTGHADRDTFDRDSTAELARWAGADLVITGSVFRAGERYRIDAQAYDTETGTVAAAKKVEGTELFAMAEELTAGLLEALEAGSAGGRAVTHVAATSSEEAFRHFAAGREEFGRLDFAAAADAFGLALGLDPDFALARLHLALTELARGNTAAAKPELEAALARASDMPEGDRLMAEGLGQFYVEGDLDAGNARLEELVERFPGNATAYAFWAKGLTDLGASPVEAAKKLRQAVAEDPNDLLAITALARLLANLGAADDARAILIEAGERHPREREVIADELEALRAQPPG